MRKFSKNLPFRRFYLQSFINQREMWDVVATAGRFLHMENSVMPLVGRKYEDLSHNYFALNRSKAAKTGEN